MSWNITVNLSDVLDELYDHQGVTPNIEAGEVVGFNGTNMGMAFLDALEITNDFETKLMRLASQRHDQAKRRELARKKRNPYK